LEQRLVAAETKLEKTYKFGIDYATLANKQADVTATQLQDLFDRIKPLEFKIFPNLSRDIVDVFKITGEGDDGGHDLDTGAPRRRTSIKPSDPGKDSGGR